MMKSIYPLTALLALLLALPANPAKAQRERKGQWQLAAETGLWGYWGDLQQGRPWLSPSQGLRRRDAGLASLGLSLERLGPKGWGWRLYAAQGAFEANDRAVDWQGNLQADAPYLGRALNVRSKIRHAGLQLVWRANNGWLLAHRARLAPYLAVGGGITHFRPFGDLFQADGAPYYYWADGSIRNLPELPENQTSAQNIEQDGTFETALWPAHTESPEGYRNFTWHAAGTAGLRWRLGHRLALQFSYTVLATGTDALDDVGGSFREQYPSPRLAYIANPAGYDGPRATQTGDRDWYTMASVGVSVALGPHSGRLQFASIYHDDAYQARIARPLPAHVQWVHRIGWIALDREGNFLPWDATFFPNVPPAGIAELAPPVAAGDDGLEKFENEVVVEETILPPAPAATAGPPLGAPPKAETAKPADKVPGPAKPSPVPSETMPATPPSATGDRPAQQPSATTPSKPEAAGSGRDTVVVVVTPPARPGAGYAAPAAADTAWRDSAAKMEQRLAQQQRQLDSLRRQLEATATSGRMALPETTALPDTAQSTAWVWLADRMMQRMAQLEARLMVLEGQGRSTAGNPAAGAVASDPALMQQLAQLNAQLQQLLAQQQASVAPTNVAPTEPSAKPFAQTVVFFEVGNATLSPWSRERLQALGAYLAGQPQAKLLLKAYTDLTGTASANQVLAAQRAEAVRQFLLQAGAKAGQLRLDYAGPDLSLTDRASSYGRRVELLRAD